MHNHLRLRRVALHTRCGQCRHWPATVFERRPGDFSSAAKQAELALTETFRAKNEDDSEQWKATSGKLGRSAAAEPELSRPLDLRAVERASERARSALGARAHLNERTRPETMPLCASVICTVARRRRSAPSSVRRPTRLLTSKTAAPAPAVSTKTKTTIGFGVDAARASNELASILFPSLACAPLSGVRAGGRRRRR